MNYRLLREGFVSSDKQNFEEVYCNESLWRDKVISDYLHNFIFLRTTTTFGEPRIAIKYKMYLLVQSGTRKLS